MIFHHVATLLFTCVTIKDVFFQTGKTPGRMRESSTRKLLHFSVKKLLHLCFRAAFQSLNLMSRSRRPPKENQAVDPGEML